MLGNNSSQYLLIRPIDIESTADNLGIVSDALRLVVANFER